MLQENTLCWLLTAAPLLRVMVDSHVEGLINVPQVAGCTGSSPSPKSGIIWRTDLSIVRSLLDSRPSELFSDSEYKKGRT
jgi:hypothetical protein